MPEIPARCCHDRLCCFQCQKTTGCVVRASRIAKKRFRAEGRVLIAGSVLKYRNDTRGCIGATTCIGRERPIADGGVATSRAVNQSLKAVTFFAAQTCFIQLKCLALSTSTPTLPDWITDHVRSTNTTCQRDPLLFLSLGFRYFCADPYLHLLSPLLRRLPSP